MVDIPYFDLLKKGFKQFFSNWVLLLTVLVSIGFMLIFVLVLGLEIGVFYALNADVILAVLQDTSAVMQLFTGLNILLLSLFAVIDLIILFIVGAYVSSMKIGMYKEIIDTGKAAAANMFSYGRKYFKTVLGYVFIRFLLLFVPLIALIGLGILSFIASKVLGVILIVLFVLAFIFYTIFIAFGFYFIEPIIVSRNVTSLEAVKASFAYMKTNFLQVLITWALSVAVALGVSFIFMPFSFFSNVGNAVAASAIFTIISMFVSIVQGFANMIISFATELFKFNVFFYNPRKK